MQARSLLFVPGNQEKLLTKAVSLPADAFIFDLEDSVPRAARAEARAMVRDHATRIDGGRVWVRMNALEDGGEADLAVLTASDSVAGLLIPKIETVDAVTEWDRLVSGREAELRRTPGSIRLMLNIESARAVLFAYDLVSASTRVVSLCFGGARDGDLMTDLGCAWSLDGPEMLHARQQTLLAARAARIASPFDGVFADVRDGDGFESDTALSRRIGYRGRQVVHPAQIEPANRLYTPTAQEVDYYARVLEAFEAAIRQGSASTTYQGRLIDQAMAVAARRVLSLADVVR